MVFNEGDEPRRVQIEARSTATLFLPLVSLSLVQISPLQRGNEFLRTSQVIGVIGVPFSGEGDYRAVMKVVIPQSIEAVPTPFDRPHQNRVLRFVLSDQDG